MRRHWRALCRRGLGRSSQEIKRWMFIDRPKPVGSAHRRETSEKGELAGTQKVKRRGASRHAKSGKRGASGGQAWPNSGKRPSRLLKTDAFSTPGGGKHYPASFPCIILMSTHGGPSRCRGRGPPFPPDSLEFYTQRRLEGSFERRPIKTFP